MKSLALAVFVLLPVSPALADNVIIEKRIGECYATQNDQARLKCYDLAIKQEVDRYNAKLDIVRQEWHGNGLLTTRPFHMGSSWEFQFDTKGTLFQAMLYHKGESTDEAMPHIVANQTGRGEGSSYVDAAGEYYLMINAIGPWTAKAVLVNK